MVTLSVRDMVATRNKSNKSLHVWPWWTSCPAFTGSGRQVLSLKALHSSLRWLQLLVRLPIAGAAAILHSFSAARKTLKSTNLKRTSCQRDFSLTLTGARGHLNSWWALSRHSSREASSTKRALQKSPKSRLQSSHTMVMLWISTRMTQAAPLRASRSSELSLLLKMGKLKQLRSPRVSSETSKLGLTAISLTQSFSARRKAWLRGTRPWH